MFCNWCFRVCRVRDRYIYGYIYIYEGTVLVNGQAFTVWLLIESFMEGRMIRDFIKGLGWIAWRSMR